MRVYRSPRRCFSSGMFALHRHLTPPTRQWWLSAASTHNPSATTRTFAARFRSSRSRRRWWWARARTTRESQRTAPCRRIHQPNMGRGELTWRQRPGAWSRVTRRLLLLVPFNRHPEQGGRGRGTQGVAPVLSPWSGPTLGMMHPRCARDCSTPQTPAQPDPPLPPSPTSTPTDPL